MLSGGKHILSIPDVGLGCEIKARIEHSGIQSKVVLDRCLPSQVGSVRSRDRRIFRQGCSLAERESVITGERLVLDLPEVCVIAAVAGLHILVTDASDRGSELEIVHRALHALEERLLADSPTG